MAVERVRHNFPRVFVLTPVRVVEPVLRGAKMQAAHHVPHIVERLRLHCASLMIQTARSMLSFTYLLFKMRVLNTAGVEYGVRASEAIRRLSLRLVRWKTH